jgi:hypothetical protein
MEFCTHRKVNVRFLLVACAMVLTAAALPMTVMAADEWPPLRSGMWEFNRTIEAPNTKPRTMHFKACQDPVEATKKQIESLKENVGCKFSPIVRAGSTYTYTAECTINGAPFSSKSVYTVESDSEYTIRVESKSGSEPSHETLKAWRTGACP